MCRELTHACFRLPAESRGILWSAASSSHPRQQQKKWGTEFRLLGFTVLAQSTDLSCSAGSHLSMYVGPACSPQSQGFYIPCRALWTNSSHFRKRQCFLFLQPSRLLNPFIQLLLCQLVLVFLFDLIFILSSTGCVPIPCTRHALVASTLKCSYVVYRKRIYWASVHKHTYTHTHNAPGQSLPVASRLPFPNRLWHWTSHLTPHCLSLPSRKMGIKILHLPQAGHVV